MSAGASPSNGGGPTRLNGFVERILFRNEETGYTVMQVRGPKAGKLLTVVGEAPLAEPGTVIQAAGAWEESSSYGPQFRLASLKAAPPAGAEGMAAYLASGIIKGVGPAMAKRLVREFGEDLTRIFEEEPERLKEVVGVGSKLAEEMASGWQKQRAVRDVMLFLHDRGLPAGRAKRIHETYGDRAISVLSEDPYGLARDVQGFGFKTADELARQLGMAEDAPERHRAGLEHVLLGSAEAGHTGLPEDEAAARLRALTGADQEAFEAAVERSLVQKRLVIDGDALYAEPLAGQETRIAEALLMLMDGEVPWRLPAPDAALARATDALGVELSESQLNAAQSLLTHKVAVLTGGPGTGKTTLVRTLLQALPLDGDEIVLAAPTGRAARRLSESTRRPARTLHRVLEADPGRGTFRRNPARPLEVSLVIVDEASMVDTALMDALLQALPKEAALLLVGDVDQLPSVGPGRVLADIIDSGVVETLALSEIFRQAEASRIVANAHLINAGRMPLPPAEGDDLVDCYVVRVRDAADATAKLQQLVGERIPKAFGIEPMSGVQVLCPTNRGTLGARALNDAVRARLNPHPRDRLVRGELTFAVGDRVMQIENDYDRDVYNGDIGRLLSLDHDKAEARVRIDEVDHSYRFSEMGALQPAFAATVHKAQGSEYPAVILVLARQHGRMLRRDLLYTGLTRAQRLAVLLVESDALDRAVRNRGERRHTRLEGLLRAGLNEPMEDAGR